MKFMKKFTPQVNNLCVEQVAPHTKPRHAADRSTHNLGTQQIALSFASKRCQNAALPPPIEIPRVILIERKLSLFTFPRQPTTQFGANTTRPQRNLFQMLYRLKHYKTLFYRVIHNKMVLSFCVLYSVSQFYQVIQNNC